MNTTRTFSTLLDLVRQAIECPPHFSVLRLDSCPKWLEPGVYIANIISPKIIYIQYNINITAASLLDTLPSRNDLEQIFYFCIFDGLNNFIYNLFNINTIKKILTTNLTNGKIPSCYSQEIFDCTMRSRYLRKVTKTNRKSYSN